MARVDRRIWWPDESCRPFFWNTSANRSNAEIGQFRIPQAHLGVIRSLTCNLTNVGMEFSTARVELTLDEVLRDEGFSPQGALTEVTQLGNDGLTHVGISIHGAGGERPCCIVLQEGLWTVWVSGAVTNVVSVTLSGYIFPRNA